MDKAIKVDNIVKKYSGKTVLDKITFDVEKGIIFGILGSNGAGKSTIIKAMSGQLNYESGAINVLGFNPNTDMSKLSYKIGVVSNDLGLYIDMSVLDNLIFFGSLFNVSKESVLETINKVSLNEYTKTKVKHLSKGYKQRVLIARALLHNPDLIFMDEPFDGLDVEIALELHKLTLLLKEEHKTIIITTHNMQEAQELCDEIIILNEGRIVAQKKGVHNDSSYLEILTNDNKISIDLNDIVRINDYELDDVKSIVIKKETLKQYYLDS
ncbi:MAG: ABC transporter ATP-binding protein, partial [Bacilli bacterium]